MKVRLCGVRGSTPSPGSAFAGVGGNTSCVAITSDDRSVPTLILDAGTGIRSVTELLAPLPFHGTILLSHLHWDHVQGLPFFGAGDRPNADVRLLIPADPSDRSGDDAAGVLRRCMSPPHFPIGPEGLNGTWTFEFLEEGIHRFEGLDVTAVAVPHKGGQTFGYRIGDQGGAVAYIPDHLPAVDGAHREAVLSLIGGVDVLVHDSQFVAAEQELATAFGHSTIEQAIDLALDAGAGALVLFHHAPGRTDEQLEALHRQFSAPRSDGRRLSVQLGREGGEFTPSSRAESARSAVATARQPEHRAG